MKMLLLYQDAAVLSLQDLWFDYRVGTEFLGLMKKVAKTPAVLEVVNIPNVQKQLDRLAELLNKIQKALGEYLERERASFPRFVGNGLGIGRDEFYEFFKISLSKRM